MSLRIIKLTQNTVFLLRVILYSMVILQTSDSLCSVCKSPVGSLRGKIPMISQNNLDDNIIEFMVHGFRD